MSLRIDVFTYFDIHTVSIIVTLVLPSVKIDMCGEGQRLGIDALAFKEEEAVGTGWAAWLPQTLSTDTVAMNWAVNILGGLIEVVGLILWLIIGFGKNLRFLVFIRRGREN